MSTTEALYDARLTRDEARARSELVEISNYQVKLDLRHAMDSEQATYPVTTMIRFTSTQPGATSFLNYLGASVDSVILNGQSLNLAEVAGTARILLPNLAADNVVVIRSHSHYSHSGEGLHRFVDPVDNHVYLYSQFEPADARRVYPNMEQPDLKAPFDITITGPENWVLASNGSESHRKLNDDGSATVQFAATKPIATYLTTFLAGPYAQFQDSWPGDPQTNAEPIELRILARQSLIESLDVEALFHLTRQGLTWFHDTFQIAYPWGKYDQAFVPEYNLGAMENPGLVTFNEEYIFTSQATISQHMSRANTIMHEMSHMWFGNLVTMQWWDDLWLKESFADFFGAKTVSEATELPGAWQAFAHQRKAWAYLQDAYPTTHPIVANIVDLEAARQNFDGITYAKGAAVIKQLFHYVGESAFLQACREYFTRFAFSTATLGDFLDIIEAASGQDMQTWSMAWLETSGAAILSATINDDGQVTVHQEAVDPVTGTNVLRPHAFYVAVFTLNEAGQLVRCEQSPAWLKAGQTSTLVEGLNVEAAGPGLLVINEHDQTYAQVTLDQSSLEAALHYPIYDPDSTAVATVWSTLWTMVRQARLPAASFTRAVAKLSDEFQEVSMHARILQQGVTAIKEFAPINQRKRLTRELSAALIDSLAVLDPGSDKQRSAARALATLGQGTDSLAPEITFLLAEGASELSPGLKVDDELRWLLLISLASVGRIETSRLDQELQESHTAANELHYQTAVAALPDTAHRHRIWMEIYHGQDNKGNSLSNAQVTASAHGLACSVQEFPTNYLQMLLEGLVDIWNSRSNNLASRTINGLFPIRHTPVSNDPKLQEFHPTLVTIDTWLVQYQDAPGALRRIVIERRTDILDRLVAQVTPTT